MNDSRKVAFQSVLESCITLADGRVHVNPLEAECSGIHGIAGYLNAFVVPARAVPDTQSVGTGGET
jgi:hypothetical protein